jgi:hypothetical protein
VGARAAYVSWPTKPYSRAAPRRCRREHYFIDIAEARGCCAGSASRETTSGLVIGAANATDANEEFTKTLTTWKEAATNLGHLLACNYIDKEHVVSILTAGTTVIELKWKVPVEKRLEAALRKGGKLSCEPLNEHPDETRALAHEVEVTK